ncbi:lysosomal acid glucosylceramidase-like [Colletes latitarsis]|uniref:lysosomal acid glucosylceramidase-like n=1 Tax=Colletes latitarsis TaxID=2605962 RepID=UPI0040353B05
MWKAFIFVAFFVVAGNAKKCEPYTVNDRVVACVCNATYCDDTPDNDPKIPEKGTSYWYVTNKEGLRMEMSKVKFNSGDQSSSNLTLTVDTKKTYQTILGFGGAFTDSTGLNIRKLSPATQYQLIRSYYCVKTGSRYNIGRIPIASTDFSTRTYSYDDVANDTSLEHFALAQEDYEYKIPYAKMALALNPETIFVASAWSAPGWMKTNDAFDHFGYLKEEYYQVYANYLALFVNEYKKHGLEMWALTTGNEPTIAYQINTTRIDTMGWKPKDMARWVANFMGPTLASTMNKDQVVLALDDDRVLLPWFVEPLFKNENASKYTMGTAVHWYFDTEAPITVLDKTREEFPDKMLLMTEASLGPPSWDSPNVLDLSWSYAERYIVNIIEYMNHWSIGWIDWNLALDRQGGPYQNIPLDATIIVNTTKDEFYKMPMYYAIKHVSRFVDRDSVRISITDDDTVKSAAFVTPAQEVVVVLYNNGSSTNSVTIKDDQQGALNLELSPYSMNTVIYKR